MKKLLFATMILPAMLFIGCSKDGGEDNCGVGDSGEYVFEFTPQEVTLPAEGGSFTINVTSSDPNYHHPEPIGNHSWLTETGSTTPCKHKGSFTFRAAANDTGAERSCAVSVCEADGSCYNVPVKQLAE